MASPLTSLESDLTCKICMGIYKEPVLLLCTHSFCKACVERSWAQRGAKECPMCRKRSSLESPPINQALENACKSFVQERNRRASVHSQGLLCPQHAERLNFFCVDDQKLVCVGCVSQEHQMHNLCSVQKAVSDQKERLQALLKEINTKLTEISCRMLTFREVFAKIQHKAQQTERQIQEEFEKLHQFLKKEEADRISALREEEEEKSRGIKEKIRVLTESQATLIAVVSRVNQHLQSDDAVVLQNSMDAEKSAQCSVPKSELDSGDLVDVAKHLGNLRYRVWEKMKESCPYVPVVLDPNTAKKTLTLSNDLSAVTESQVQDLPNNPERFSIQPFVLGSEGFDSGMHSWVVEVGDSTEWTVGVAKESVKRKEKIQHFKKNGIWAIRFYNKKYSFKVSSPVIRFPRIKVELDKAARQVRFYNPETNEQLHSFTGLSKEKIYPLFGAKLGTSLKILPAKVSVECSVSPDPLPACVQLKIAPASSSSDSETDFVSFETWLKTQRPVEA